MAKEIKWGIVGYGGSFNMGKLHGESANGCEGMRVIAVCDIDPARTVAAKKELPDIVTYDNLTSMLGNDDIDNIQVILPHDLHYPAAMECMNAGKGVVLEKPMCITTQQATDMIELSKKKGVLLTVFHNRRHDGDYKAVKEFISKGMIGDVFRIEAFMGGFGHPGTWWRSDKKISGGNFYDWGAHQVDWVLNFLEGRKMKSVTGFFQKKVWMDITNEDETQAIVRFDDDVVADITISQIAKVGKPRWRILGTKGAIEDRWSGSFKAFVDVNGYPAELNVGYQPSTWEAWYPNLAAHLIEGKPLEVKPEEGRRVIMIMDYAERSAKEGKTIETPFE